MRPLDRRRRWFAAWFSAGDGGLRRSRRQLRLMPGQFPYKTFFCPGFDRRSSHRELLQPVLTAGQFLRDRHAAGNIGLIRCFGLRQQFGHSAFSCASILPACSYGNAPWRLALA